jgi:hypothetical protein
VAEAQHACNVLGRRDDGGPYGPQTSTLSFKQMVSIFDVEVLKRLLFLDSTKIGWR